jgi:hypothetical protein
MSLILQTMRALEKNKKLKTNYRERERGQIFPCLTPLKQEQNLLIIVILKT